MLRLMRKGQSTAEYAIVIGLVVAAAVAMQVYVKRGIQSKIKDAVDGTLGAGQYEPYYLTTSNTSTRNLNNSEATSTGGGVARTVSDASNSSGSQVISAAQ